MNENMIACNLTFEEINKLADKVETGKLSKIKIKNGDCEIVIEKENKIAVPAAIPPVIPAPAVPMAAASGESAPAADTASQVSGNIVKAPIVGTFYSKPAPDKSPFVQIGTSVKKGDVLMIIESMKLMNEVQSEFDGVVKDILVKDGEAVEYDQPVMVIE
ncbi:MAG: acetyl-CoA carboxylase biotin carboxyl carrier protein [Clostridium sp.]|nr:acetyl-CoA carboxylase biotin carboxyl carrier protein [Clostridium sp.]MCM1547947.1 acetyl-CoA carboxylase biotin carboxyl carrier protein [Ruminococcus sp.]